MTPWLSGIRVVECSAFVAAPLGGLTLALLGADVIRVDPIEGGLDERRWPLSDEGRSLFWLGLNRSKRSVRLDLSSPPGRELLRALLAAQGGNGGVFSTNLPILHRLGGYETLQCDRGDMIVVEIEGNPDGSSEVDYSLQPATGFPLVAGPTGHNGPVNSPLPAWDLLTGMHAALAIVCAVRQRERSGAGEHIKIALSDVAFSTVAALGRLHPTESHQTERLGNAVHGGYGDSFQTGDGAWVMVVGLTDHQWANLIACIDTDNVIRAALDVAKVDLSCALGRFHGREAISALLRPWFNNQPMSLVAEQLTSRRVTWGRYQKFQDLMLNEPRCDPTQNPLWTEIDVPAVGRIRTPASPIRSEGAAAASVRTYATVGQHTEEVLTEVLGLTQHQIGRLVDSGTVGLTN